MDANPSSTQGAITILQSFQNYQPVKHGVPYPMVLWGDGLTAERHNDAQLAVANGRTPEERLENLTAGAQEFHLRMLHAQV